MREAKALEAQKALSCSALQRLQRFRRFQRLLILSALIALGCDDDVVAPTRGTLEITITGVPAGQAAAVTVAGPGNFSRGVTASTTLNDLEPGSYTVTAANIDAADSRWSPTPATQAVTVNAGPGATTASVTYALVTARLAVTISGLPNGVNANVTVSGPNGYTNALTSSTAINLLTPGAYTITAADVTSGATTYRPAPTTQTLQLPASTTQVAANVVYAVASGTLTVTISGLPAGTSAAVHVTGPSGYSQQLSATQTLTPVPAGTYTINASPVGSNLTTHTPAPLTQSVDVTAGGTAAGTVTYTASPLVLAVQQVAQGLESPVYLTAPANDSRLFIVEQRGRIRVVKNGTLLTTPFLDISARVTYGGEQGLLSMAFDPAYATNGRFYVSYTGANGDIFVDRHTVLGNPDVANTAFDQVITIQHRLAGNHNGGLVMFGPDGMLYLGTGDGGGSGDQQNNGQNVNSLLGKLLRLNVASLPYTIPAGNPFVGTTGADEIWAYGLRNPWRYAFDGAGGTIYVADVGQNVWEEVNAVPAATAGVNYGWRRTEGTHCYPPDSSEACDKTGLTLPVLEYNHGEGCSITGGFVYRGAAIPELTGHYLYSDYCSGFLRSFRLSGGQAVDQRSWSIGFIGNILSFGVDAAGEVYMLSSNGGAYRIVK
jgi:glucose/arabinose dehydrogenase